MTREHEKHGIKLHDLFAIIINSFVLDKVLSYVSQRAIPQTTNVSGSLHPLAQKRKLNSKYVLPLLPLQWKKPYLFQDRNTKP